MSGGQTAAAIFWRIQNFQPIVQCFCAYLDVYMPFSEILYNVMSFPRGQVEFGTGPDCPSKVSRVRLFCNKANVQYGQYYRYSGFLEIPKCTTLHYPDYGLFCQIFPGKIAIPHIQCWGTLRFNWDAVTHTFSDQVSPEMYGRADEFRRPAQLRLVGNTRVLNRVL